MPNASEITNDSSVDGENVAAALDNLQAAIEDAAGAVLASDDGVVSYEHAAQADATTTWQWSVPCPVGTNLLISGHISVAMAKAGNGGLRTFEGSFAMYRDQFGDIQGFPEFSTAQFVYTSTNWGAQTTTGEITLDVGTDAIRFYCESMGDSNVYVVARAQLSVKAVPFNLSPYTE